MSFIFNRFNITKKIVISNLNNNINNLRLFSAKLIDGKSIAKDIQNRLKLEIEEWVKMGQRSPTLHAIIIGDDPASVTYVNKKMEASKEVGIKSERIQLPKTSTEEEIIKKIKELNENPEVDGILVQLPVPETVSERNVCNAVDPKKDVDGFHILNVGKLALNMDCFVPCTALAVIELIKWFEEDSNTKVLGKNVVVCGRSKNVGLPIFNILHSDARYKLSGLETTVTLCHRHTPKEQLDMFTKTADVVISATGVVGLIRKEMIKKGACVIDVGINRIKTPEGKTKLVGDVDFNGVKEVAGYITPVPGGVGPMTVAMLMRNTFEAAKLLAQ